jgi:DNA adenine methylase
VLCIRDRCYADPPYWGCETDRGRGMFVREDFERLAAVLANLKGKFLLSLNDVSEVRRIFGAFAIETVATSYSVSNGPAKRVREVLISNRQLST